MALRPLTSPDLTCKQPVGDFLRPKSVLVLVGSLACALSLAAASSTSGASANRARAVATEAFVHVLGRRIASSQRTTWRWQRLMGLPLAQTEGRALAEMNLGDIAGAAELWQRRAATAEAQARHAPHLRAWLCIHRYEGSWTDPGAPYYGGLQMDLGFQHTYGQALLVRKGTANNWSPLEQMWVAERALNAGRGFWPWPNTARYCGLL